MSRQTANFQHLATLLVGQLHILDDDTVQETNLYMPNNHLGIQQLAQLVGGNRRKLALNHRQVQQQPNPSIKPEAYAGYNPKEIFKASTKSHFH